AQSRSALRAAREVPAREVEARDERVGCESDWEELSLAADALHGARAEGLGVGLREPHVRQCPPDPAVLDEPHAVPRQPADDLRSRVEDPGVPEVQDVDPALDAGDQPVVVTVARRDDELPAQRPPRPAALDRMPRALRPAAGRGGGPPRVLDGAGDAVDNQVDAPARRALDVEPETDHARVRDVVA